MVLKSSSEVPKTVSSEKISTISVAQEPKNKLELSEKPLIHKKEKSKFNIADALKVEEKKEDLTPILPDKEAPQNHFTETDLQQEWIIFLEDLKTTNSLVYNAINSFKLNKIGENGVEICCPSKTAKAEFSSVSAQFFNHFKHKVNNFHIEVTYKMDSKLKKEILTKRKIFDKFAEINPVLNDLNDLMKFDFT